MVLNYIIIAFRNFLRNKNYTIINILGLSIGLTACVIIYLVVDYDFKFDTFHSKYDHIYRVVQSSKTTSGQNFDAATPYPLAQGLRNDFPEIPLVTQLHYEMDCKVSLGEDKHLVNNVLFADSVFFKVFDFPLGSGNPHVELGQPGKAFITQSLWDKIGKKGSENKTLKLENLVEVDIAGIIPDPPVTSHIRYSMIVSFPSLTPEFIGGFQLDQWGFTSSGFTYIAVPDQMLATSVKERFRNFVRKYYEEKDADRKALHLQPLSDVHFDEQYLDNPGSTNARYSDLVIMGILGGFILVIACINFVNLATALAVKKSKEIGVRKTLGAKQHQLTVYFLLETFLLTMVSILVSMCMVELSLRWLNTFLEKEITLNILSNPGLILFMSGLIIVTTVLSGFYPAMVLSRFNPVSVLKNKITGYQTSGAGVRKMLVVFQFMIAQMLIIGTLVVAHQMEYFRSKPLGFNKEAVITVPMPERKAAYRQQLRARLEGNTAIQNVSFSIGAPTSENNIGTNFFLTEAGKENLYSVNIKAVDRHYLDTYEITLLAGRWFTESDEKQIDPEIPATKQKYVYVINEAAVKRLGFYDPAEVIGKNITTGINSIDGEVIGVVSDFHVASLHNEIKPVALINFPYFYYEAGIRLNQGRIPQTLEFIEEQWKAVFPEHYFEYTFVNEKLAGMYRQEERTFGLFKVLAAVSIFIGCLGLYGLVSFMANQKLKEVGIRKILGASAGSIVVLFSKEFIKLIAIAFVIAAPVAWYVMNTWLQDFAYRISIPWSVFVLAVLVTLVIALLTVSYRSVRAAFANPAETLRTE